MKINHTSSKKHLLYQLDILKVSLFPLIFFSVNLFELSDEDGIKKLMGKFFRSYSFLMFDILEKSDLNFFTTFFSEAIEKQFWKLLSIIFFYYSLNREWNGFNEIYCLYRLCFALYMRISVVLMLLHEFSYGKFIYVKVVYVFIFLAKIFIFLEDFSMFFQKK